MIFRLHQMCLAIQPIESNRLPNRASARKRDCVCDFDFIKREHRPGSAIEVPSSESDFISIPFVSMSKTH